MTRHWFRKLKAMAFTYLFLSLAFAVACGAAATATPVPKAAAPEAPKAPVAAAPAEPAAPAAAATPIPKASPVPAPALPARPKVERLKMAIAPLGFDTNVSWDTSRSGLLDKRPNLEYLVGIDRNTTAYIPELATKWEMSPDGKSWTFWLRPGIQFHDGWGEFTAKDVPHSVWAVGQPGSTASDAGYWPTLAGRGKTSEEIAGQFEIVNDHQIVFKLKRADPELLEVVSSHRDLVMESKARWDKDGLEGYRKKIVGTGPFRFKERQLGQYVLHERVDNHWRQTPEFKELEFRWVQEEVTRLATLVSGEVHMSDIARSNQKQALDKGFKLIPSKFPAIQHQWIFGGLYFQTPDKFDPQLPWVKREVRQAMSMAVNRKELNSSLFAGKGEPHYMHNFHKVMSGPVWNPEWERRFDELYGYNPVKARELLKQAGYPNGFGFKITLFTLPGLPEIPQIGEALTVYFKAVGLQPVLEEIDFPRAREAYRTKNSSGQLVPFRHAFGGHSSIFRQFYQSKDSTVYAFEDAFFDQKWAELGKVVDPGARDKIFREIGDKLFSEFPTIPLVWLFADIMVDSKVVAEYVFTGTYTGFYAHLEYIKLVR